MIVSEQMVTALATAAFPTFAVVIGILISDQRLTALSRRFSGFDQGFAEMNRRLDDMKDVLLADMLRFEQVIDARLKRLEARL